MAKNLKFWVLGAIATFAACDDQAADALYSIADDDQPAVAAGTMDGIKATWLQDVNSSEYRMDDGNALVTLIFIGDTVVNQGQLAEVTFELEDVGGANDVDEEGIRYGMVQYRGEDEGVDIDIADVEQTEGTLKLFGEFELETPDTRIEDVSFVATAKRVDDPTQ